MKRSRVHENSVTMGPINFPKCYQFASSLGGCVFAEMSL